MVWCKIIETIGKKMFEIKVHKSKKYSFKFDLHRLCNKIFADVKDVGITFLVLKTDQSVKVYSKNPYKYSTISHLIEILGHDLPNI